MKVYKSLINIILIYLLLYFSINAFFGLIYSLIAWKNQIDSSFLKWYYFAMMNFATISHGDIVPLPNMRIIILIQYIFTSIINPITSGFIFYYILNRTPKIKFSKNILIRKRTSIGSNDQITLGIMVGNKNKSKIYNVTSTVVYIYHKSRFDGKITTNAETIISQTVPYIKNFYRFSFEINKFPIVLLKSIVSPDNLSQNDSFVVIINGKYGDYGDSFISEKLYNISDLVIAKETELISENRAINNLITWNKPIWNNMDSLINYSSIEEEEIKIELEKAIEKSHKSILNH